MKISTIVPIYNTEEFLDRCINSIINQTIGFDHIQLILVNDGSNDNSGTIAKGYAEKYNNIVYIEQKNSGQAAARNKGLSTATGEYISFVDSDDWIEPETYKELYDKASLENLDIVTCDYSFVADGIKEYVSFDFDKNLKKNFIIMNTGPCNMIIKRKYLNEINFEFPKGIIYEDLACIPALGFGSSKIGYIQKAYYNYYIRNGSTMNSSLYNEKLNDIFKAFDNLYSLWVSNDKKKEYYNEIEFLYIRRLMMSASLRFIKFKNCKNQIKEISGIIREKFPNWNNNLYFKKLPFKQKIVAYLVYFKQIKLLRLLFIINERSKK